MVAIWIWDFYLAMTIKTVVFSYQTNSEMVLRECFQSEKTTKPNISKIGLLSAVVTLKFQELSSTGGAFYFLPDYLMLCSNTEMRTVYTHIYGHTDNSVIFFGIKQMRFV